LAESIISRQFEGPEKNLRKKYLIFRGKQEGAKGGRGTTVAGGELAELRGTDFSGHRRETNFGWRNIRSQ